MRRNRGGPKKRRHNRRRPSSSAAKKRAVARERAEQRPAATADLERRGKYAVEEARADNAKKLQKRLIGSSDGTVYHKLPSGQMVKSTLRVVELPDGTLRPVPPDPRPTKRERAKMKRRLKHERGE